MTGKTTETFRIVPKVFQEKPVQSAYETLEEENLVKRLVPENKLKEIISCLFA